jgi:AraC family transcriptional regulator of adaptative response / DNA-3-methyladenine glycosylase II
MRIILPYTPPYDWAAMMQFLAVRATPRVERVDDAGYHRTISVRGFDGSISVAPMTGADALTVDVSIPDRALVPSITEGVARMFDVDTDPAVVIQPLAEDPMLNQACAAHAGIRLPGAWDPFELAVRAILGQQISVRAATTMAGRVAERWGEPIEDATNGLDRLFPSAARLADAPLEEAGIIPARAGTIRQLAQQVVAGTLAFNSPAALQSLRAIAGIGDWTAQYIAMRALGNPDAFPSGDLVLRRMAGDCSARALDAQSERWRPWRAYAVMLLWQAATDQTAAARITTAPRARSRKRKPDAKVDRVRRTRAPRARRANAARRPAKGRKHTRR